MKRVNVMWLVNSPLPAISVKLGIESSVNEGWLTGLADSFNDNNVDLTICFPFTKNVRGRVGKYSYVGYKATTSNEIYSSNLKYVFEEIINVCKPDIIHIMGTEFPHCYSMIEAAKICEKQEQTLISIQGLISECAKYYFSNLPAEVYCKGRTLRDALKHTSLKIEQKKYVYRGEYEIKALKECANVMGRTEWDQVCTMKNNPCVRYFHGGETLRASFYNDIWNINQCECHSIFVSQATYPLKGFHVVLEALKILKPRFPDCKLYVASAVGYPLAKSRPRWRNSQYVNYICDLMRNLGIEDDVVFLGALQENEMKQRYLKSNVFVSASSIENSSNSVGEAMLLGMPIVSSYVGGIPSLLKDREEGFLYPSDEPCMLAHYIEQYFLDENMAVLFGERARIRALNNHDRTNNLRDVFTAYDSILKTLSHKEGV